jgi:hypothetical protein
MTQEELEEKIKHNTTYITPDEQKRFDDVLDAIDGLKDAMQKWADGKMGVTEIDSDNLAKLAYFALYGIWFELDGLMADWKYRMEKEAK